LGAAAKKNDSLAAGWSHQKYKGSLRNASWVCGATVSGVIVAADSLDQLLDQPDVLA
jgi:hypothetical protein